MKLQDISRIADWLYDIWPYYLQYREERVTISSVSKDNPTDKLRASKLFECSKKYAAERRGLIRSDDVISFDLARKFDLGVRVAESVQEAILYGAGLAKIPMKVSFEDENRSENEFLSGTPDAMIQILDSWVPIEIKHTGFSFTGYSFTQIKQLIGYMELVDSDYGFLYTVYSSGDVSHNVWIVQRSEDKEGWYVLNREGKNLRTGYNFVPHTWDGTVYFTRAEYNKLIQRHLYWQSQPVTTDTIPDDIETKDWRCGSLIDPQYAQRKSANYNKGDIKDGTGVFRIRCPLARYCYPHLNIQDDETELPVEFDGSKYVRRLKP